MRAFILSLPRPSLCAALLLLCGCAALRRGSHGGDGSEARRSVDSLGCPAGDIVITDASYGNAGMYYSWTATGCGRTTQCERNIDMNGDETRCGAVTAAPLPAVHRAPARPEDQGPGVHDVRAPDDPPPSK